MNIEKLLREHSGSGVPLLFIMDEEAGDLNKLWGGRWRVGLFHFCGSNDPSILL
jgi:hypothetical protein